MKRITGYIKITIMLAGLTALFLGLGYYFLGEGGIYYALIFSLLFNLVAYWFSDKLALLANGAQPLSKEQLPWLYSETEKLCKKMDIPMPKLYVSNQSQPNAFATGRNPKNSAVCVTAGLVNSLEKNQVVAVMAHELAHIKSWDILIASMAAVIAGSISSIGRFAFWGGGRDREGGSNALGLIFLILSPILAMIIQFAISRSREYEADAVAAKYTGKPKDLASALIAISDNVKNNPMEINPAYSSLYILNPLNSKGFLELFSTHPAVEKRIERLMEV